MSILAIACLLNRKSTYHDLKDSKLVCHWVHLNSQINKPRSDSEVGWSKLKSSHQSCSIKKLFLKISQNSQEETCARVSFLACNFSTETLAQVFSCKFCEFFKTPFSSEHLWKTASLNSRRVAKSFS